MEQWRDEIFSANETPFGAGLSAGADYGSPRSAQWALKHRPLVAYFMIVAVAAGLLSYFRLGRSEDPSFVIKTMVVQAAWPGATIEETLKQVPERLERKLQETPYLDFLRSYTTRRCHDHFRQSQGQRAGA